MDAVNRRMMWTDPVMKFIDVSTAPRRIVGVVADVDDENVVPRPTMTVYHPMEQEIGGGRLFVHAKMDPYALVAAITKIIRESRVRPAGGTRGDAGRCARGGVGAGSASTRWCSADSPASRWRSRSSASQACWRSPSAPGRASSASGWPIGSTPRALLTRILREGAVIGVTGIVAGAIGGLALARIVGSYVDGRSRFLESVPIVGAAACSSPRRFSRR